MKKSRIREIWDYVDGLEQRVFHFQAELNQVQAALDQSQTDRADLAEKITAIQPIAYSVPAIGRAVAKVTRGAEELEERMSQLVAAQAESASRTDSDLETLRRESSELRQKGEETKQASDTLMANQSNLEYRLGLAEALHHEMNELRRQGDELRRVSQELTTGQHTLEQRAEFVRREILFEMKYGGRWSKRMSR